jgi:predicted dehydrogenase
VTPKTPIARRDLLKSSAAGLAAAAILAGCAQQQKAAAPAMTAEETPKETGTPAPSERVVVGSIGTGDLGRRHHLANCLLPNKRVQVAAVCDVDRDHRDEAAQIVKRRTGKRVGVYEDYRSLLDRKDIDAVLIAVPDHWHVPVAMAAIEAGKDVYCEKPLTLTVNEGKSLVIAARRYGTVFQTGSQQRSDGRFRQACELVRNGKIGKILRVDTVLHAVQSGNWTPVQTPPANLNWDFYLGQAPYADYHENFVHYQFRWFYDYSGGVMTDWGAHHNDIAQWALGMDGSGPVHVDGRKATFHEEGPHSVAGTFDVMYRYADGTELYCHTGDQSYPDGTKFGNGVKFTGEKGWIFVSRGEIKASDPELLKNKAGSLPIKLYKSDSHHDNWLDCIKSRERCICDVEIGHRSASVCHIGNISIRLGRPLEWDPAKEEFVGDEVANQMLSSPFRAPWYL